MPLELRAERAGRLHVVGHRGHSAKAPENTCAAIALAARSGATLCEIDVVLTRDREVVCLHDDWVDRTTDGRGLVSLMTREEVHRLRVPWSGGPPQAVPTLAEALRTAREGGIGLVIEIKERYRFAGEPFLDQVAAAVAAAAMGDRVAITSFDHGLLRSAKARLPGVPTVAIVQERLANPLPALREALADAVVFQFKRFDPAMARSLRNAGFAVQCGAIDRAEIERYAAAGLDLEGQLRAWIGEGIIDGLSSDDVDYLAGLLPPPDESQ